MLKIYKVRSASPIDFAAEELKKYLRMMMPEGGDVKISYDKTATDGFRLGLLADFGLDTSDVSDPEKDDVIYYTIMPPFLVYLIAFSSIVFCSFESSTECLYSLFRNTSGCFLYVPKQLQGASTST